MARLAIEDHRSGTTATDEQYRRLETGDILYFPSMPFELSTAEREFLLRQRQTGGTLHKNISYRPSQNCLTGIDQKDGASRQQMHQIMKSFSERAVSFMSRYL